MGAGRGGAVVGMEAVAIVAVDRGRLSLAVRKRCRACRRHKAGHDAKQVLEEQPPTNPVEITTKG